MDTIIIGAIIAIGLVWVIIASIRRGIRDKVAHDVLDQTFDFEKEKTDILAVNKFVGYGKTESACPACGGILIARRGPHGAFLVCRNYPQCHFTRPKN